MKQFALAALCVIAVGCSTGGDRVVDGAPVSQDGWPVRPTEASFRCPPGTDLVDESLSDGRRRVTCKTPLNPAPSGFELAWHANGQLALVRQFDEQGRPQSVFEYGSDGEKLVVEEWEDGTRRSARAWYPTGQVRQIETWNESRGSLYFESYAPDGSIEAQGEIVGDERQGRWTEWVDGATERANYEDGVRVGEVTRTYADGSVETGSYNAGQRHGLWRRVDSNELPMKEARYVNGVLEGPWQAWHPNQQMKARGSYLAGLQHGEWTTWFPSGQAAESATYSCGIRHGSYREFHPNGELAERGVFWNGKKIGEWRYWSNRGDLTKIDTFPVPDGSIDLQELKSGEIEPELPASCAPADRPEVPTISGEMETRPR